MSDAVPASRKSKKPPAKPRRAGFIGPLFSWELVRLARRGQDARARFILAISLFFVLTFFSLVWFRKTSPVELFFGEAQQLALSESADFGAAFTLAFLLAQLGILVLLTPAYAAGGIAEEKERKTFTFLLMSELTAREIVFGKFLGRMTFLLGIMFAGLPILAICQMHGGASIEFLLVSYLVTMCTVIFLAAISAACAAAAETLRGALFRAYGLTAVIVLTGCGVYPALSPFAIIPILFSIEARDQTWFWVIGLGYPLLEFFGGILAVLLAVRSIRRLRARMTPLIARPPRRVLDRYAREDRELERYEKLLKEWEEAVEWEKERRRRMYEMQKQSEPNAVPSAPPPEAPLELEADVHSVPGSALPPRPKAQAIPIVRLSARQPGLPPKPQMRVKVQPRSRKRAAVPEYVSDRPSLRSSDDPFLWKERYTSGAVRTEDDDAMRAMMYLMGGVLILIVVFFLGIAIISFYASGGSSSGMRAVKWLLLTSGGAGMFVHLLSIGMASCASICKERQRLTLESLLTIPVDRREILWPKWKVCMLRGVWWGAPAAIMMALAFLASDVVPAFFPAVAYFILAIPFATSYGVWLSIRCPTVNKALMWFLPMAGFLVMFPVACSTWFEKDLSIVAMVLVMVLNGILAAGAWLFWKAAERAFERETVLGAGQG